MQTSRWHTAAAEHQKPVVVEMCHTYLNFLSTMYDKTFKMFILLQNSLFSGQFFLHLVKVNQKVNEALDTITVENSMVNLVVNLNQMQKKIGSKLFSFRGNSQMSIRWILSRDQNSRTDTKS